MDTTINHKGIVAVGVRNQPPDIEHLATMLQRICAIVRICPR